MLELTRTVRLALGDPDGRPVAPRHNGFSAWPALRGLGRFYQLTVSCRGQVSPVTGYFINIVEIDEAVRTHALPILQAQVDDGRPDGQVPMGTLMVRLLTAMLEPLNHSVVRLRLELSPYYSLQIGKDAMNQVILRQQFEFAAAHRLHVPTLSDQENRRIFGKCNNPSGHGHNYRLEVAVRAPIDPAGQLPLVEQLDAVVDQTVIAQLDHKHLNQDVPQFAQLNPSVENIAMVIYDMLSSPVKTLGVALEEVSVWETSKTLCTYRGAGKEISNV